VLDLVDRLGHVVFGIVGITGAMAFMRFVRLMRAAPCRLRRGASLELTMAAVFIAQKRRSVWGCYR
jgi:hypothetical protein